MKKLRFYILAIITVFTLSLVGFNVYAEETPSDVTYTFNSSSNLPTNICGTSSTPACSDYQYLTVTSNFGFNTFIAYASMTYQYNDSYITTARLYFNSPSLSLNISDFARISVDYFNNVSSLPSDWSVTFTLTNSSGCPVCPTCPEQLDPNRSPIMDDFHNVFINTMLSVIPITAIIFVVWFFIDMLSSLVFGRGK